MNEAEIKQIMDEAAKIVSPKGSIFVASYRVSAAVENLLTELGFLHKHVLQQRENLAISGRVSLQRLCDRRFELLQQIVG